MEKENSINMLISVLALAISLLTAYFGYFHQSASIISKVTSVDYELIPAECSDENDEGKCIEYDFTLNSIIINSGNMPATILTAWLGYTDFNNDESCLNTKVSHGMGGEPNIVNSASTKVDVRKVNGYFFLKEARFSNELNNLLYFCVKYEGIDNNGNEIQGSDLILGINVEYDDGEYLIHFGDYSPTIKVE